MTPDEGRLHIFYKLRFCCLSMDIKGKVVIVTGASQGIGLAAAKHLSSLGAKVVLAARSFEAILSAAKSLPDALAVKADMTSPSDIKALMAATIAKYGRIDILVNNAGQGMHGFPVKGIDIEKYKQIMDLNVYGVVAAMQEAILQMRKQGGGIIVNVSSMLSKMHVPLLGPYASTKWALNCLSLTARDEFAADKIIVSLVLPGHTATNFQKNAHQGPASWGAGRQMPVADSPEKVAEAISAVIASERAEQSV